MNRLALGILSVITAILLLTGCEKNSTGPEDEFGSVSGTVNFIGTWPTTGEIQISVFSSFPPAGPPDYFTEPLPANTTNYGYKIDGVTKGDYAAIVVGWRDPGNPAGAKTIGYYIDAVDQIGVDTNGNPVALPKSVTIDDGKMDLADIDIKANLDVVQ